MIGSAVWLDLAAGPFVDKCVLFEIEADDVSDSALLPDTTVFTSLGVLQFYIPFHRSHTYFRTPIEHEIAHVVEATDERFVLPNLGMPDRCAGPEWADVEARTMGIEVALARQLGLPSDWDYDDMPIAVRMSRLAMYHHSSGSDRLVALYEKAVLFNDPVGEFRRKLRLLP